MHLEMELLISLLRLLRKDFKDLKLLSGSQSSSHTLAHNSGDFFEIDKFSSTDPTTAKLAVGALIGAGMFVVCVVAGGVMFMMPFVPPNWPLTRAGFAGQ